MLLLFKDILLMLPGKALGTTAMVPVPYEKMLMDQGGCSGAGAPRRGPFQHPENKDCKWLKARFGEQSWD